MKVGILTFFRVINNGAILQACALNRIVLTKLGVESELIDYRLPRVEFYRKPFNLKRIIKARTTISKLKATVKEIIRYPRNKKINRLFEQFMIENLIVSAKKYITIEDLELDQTNYNAFIVGSDLVWNPLMAEGVNPVYYLDFVRVAGIKKIAYAPSVGTLDITEDEKQQISCFLNGFDAISVREESTAMQLKLLTDKTIQTVLDPTLLTYATDWDDFYKEEPLERQKYIFAFKLEESDLLVNIVNQLALNNDYIILSFDGPIKGFRAKKVKNLGSNMGPSEFLNYVKHADCIVTNSYHGCAFSIIFHKDFYCIPHSSRGIRMINLLEKLNISDRLVYDENIGDRMPIDYQAVEQIRANYINSSYDYLYKALFGDYNND